ncbi:MAG: DUF2939 domain-containing protein [Nitrospinae bacterium]|nr:DUF2939 domain-containing protein [Nitrospinota bacterium]
MPEAAAPEGAVKAPPRPGLMIRRGKKVTEGVAAQTVIADIKSGQLKPSHEFSMDGIHWRRLDSHVQLAKVFAAAPKKPPSGKKGIWIFLFLLLLVGFGVVYAHPYWVFYETQMAADGRNVDKLSLGVDYSALYQDIKRQVDSQWDNIAAQKINNTPYAKSALPKGRILVDRWINTLVTPEAVMAYSRGQTDVIGSPTGKKSSKKKASQEKVAPDPWANLGLNVESAVTVFNSVSGVLARADLSYRDVNTFTATVKANNGENVLFRYERRGMDWKVAGVQLPAGSISTSLKDIAQSTLKQARNQARAEKRKKKIKKAEDDKKQQVQVAKLVNINKAYMANLELRNLSVGKGKKYLFGSPNPGVFATLSNKGNRTLNELEITIYFYNRQGAIVSEKKLYPVSVSKYRRGRDNDPLRPNGVKKVGYLVKKFAPASWAGKVQMRVTHIVLKD